MADYPKTDEGWEHLAEQIVTRHPTVQPETVGGLTVEATQTIFSWYSSEERSKALYERQYARDRLMELASEAESDVIKLSGRMIEVPLEKRKPTERPFPQTYGDWVNVAEDVKSKMPRDAWHIVNELLQAISEGGPVAEEAKRWLMQKAGELGVG